MHKTSSHLLIIATLLLPGIATALSSDRDQPIEVEADRVEFDEKRGISTYSGNVTFSQGSLHATADVVTIHTLNGQLDRVIAKGKPATFRQRPDESSEDVRGSGEQLEYQAETEQLTLSINAELYQKGNRLSSQRIVYDAARDSAVAGSTSTDSSHKPKNERVRITIQPRERKPAEKP